MNSSRLRHFVFSHVRRSGSYRPSMRFETMPFEAALAGQAMEGPAFANLMIGIPERLWRTDQESLQPSLAVYQRQVADVLATQEQQVEQEQDQRSPGSVGRRPGQVEGRSAHGQHPAKVSHQLGVPAREHS